MWWPRIGHARRHRRVPGDVTAAVTGLGQPDVVDPVGARSGPADGFGHHGLGRVQGTRVRERPLRAVPIGVRTAPTITAGVLTLVRL